MSWETVKGFCRRQTQNFKENFQHASKTEDAEFDSIYQRFQSTFSQAKRVSSRVVGVHHDLVDVIGHYDKLKDDLNMGDVNSVQSSEMQTAAKRVELATLDFRQKFGALDQTLQDTIAQLSKYQQEATQVTNVIDDRKMKMLEFDFFRNKLSDLRANPPADTTRIPRNEQRLNEWSTAYQEANARCKQMLINLHENGEKLVLLAASVLTVDAGRFFLELGKTANVLFLGTAAPPKSLRQTELEAGSLAPQVQTTSPTTAPPQTTQQPAASGNGSRRYFSTDDPFRSE